MAHALMVGGIKTLEILFAGGLIGSVILIILTSIEDFREVFQRDTPEETQSFGD
jgi:hypothetical protein